MNVSNIIIIILAIVAILTVVIAIRGFGYEPNKTEDDILRHCIQRNLTSQCSQLYGGPVIPDCADSIDEVLCLTGKPDPDFNDSGNETPYNK